MAWLILVASGILEVAWASMLPATQGFTRPLTSALVLALIAASMVGLAIATRSIPIGTAYAVWVGIGAAGTMIAGVLVYHEPLTILRAACLAMLLASVIGLRLTGTTH